MICKNIVIAKLGLDGHDRGAKVVVKALTEAGFNVKYTGLHNSPKQVAEIAIEHGAQIVGVSIHSGAHNELVPALTDELAKIGASQVSVILGGTIPEGDREPLLARGISAIFCPGATFSEIIDCCSALVTVEPSIKVAG